MTKVSDNLRAVDAVAGVFPSTEGTALETRHWRASQGVRFVNGRPQKGGGYESFDFAYDKAITGSARSITSVVYTNRTQTLVGTNTRLYNISGSTLTNITPVVVVGSAVAAADSLATLYGNLSSNPFTTTNGSAEVVIADTSASRFRVGDTVTLSGASTTNGIPDSDFNTSHKIRAIGTNQYTIITSTSATSSGTGGGTVGRACGLIEVSDTAHGLTDGDRVRIAAATTSGGITDAQINLEFEIRVTGVDDFDVMTAGTSTSSVSAAGGSSTTYQPQIAAGNADEGYGQGYGMGLYGVGLYGTSLVSSSGRNLVRTWFFDKFGDYTIATAGNQTGLYEWDGDVTDAPVLVSNAPTAINYAFVSDNILVTLGASGVPNKIKGTNVGDRTDWTVTSGSAAFEDNIEGAGRFLSHAHVNGVNLLFTDQQTYTFRYIGISAGIWEIKQKDPAIGIIAPMARVVVNGIAYWMGENNFYMWKGGNIEIVPANTQNQSTILKYVFDNLNLSQRSKIFAWHNEKYNEVWFHYPSLTSNEPDRVAVIGLQDMSWWPDLSDRTAAEYPNINLQYPRLISSDNTMYYHEKGNDADGAALSWSVQTPDYTYGRDNAYATALYPDNVQVGSVSVAMELRQYPQSTSTYGTTYTATATTDRITISQAGRFWNYTFSGSEVDQTWRMGTWLEEMQKGATV